MQHVVLTVGADTRPMDAALQKSLSRVAQPLGKITGSVSDFDKSLSASNARVLAFGASAASIYSLKRAFDFTVSSMVEVEKALTDISVLLNLSNSQLDSFGGGLFQVANSTASSFRETAKAAGEFARQGLGVNEILQRTEAAMGLSRLSGLDLADSISAVTAAMNTFNKEGLNSFALVDKLAAVDAAFAVSSADLAQSIKRVGSVAEDSNVSLEQMLALTAATQQKTARGGAIIGNAFKTIFTRLNRPEVLTQLEELGIKTRDVTGQIRPLMQIMTELAQRYDKLTPAAKSTTSELLGGVFQINILKAAMSDLGSEFSVYNEALKTAENSTGAFAKRNEELNKSLSARMVQSVNLAAELGEKVGSISLKPALSGGINLLNSSMKDLNQMLSVKETIQDDGTIKKEYLGFGGELGHEIVKGIFGAVGGLISGPLLQILATITTKLAVGFVSFTLESGKSLLGLESKASLYRKTLEQCQYVLSTHPQLLKQISDGTLSVKDVQESILKLLEAQTQQMKLQGQVSERIAGVRAGYLTDVGGPVPTTISKVTSKIKRTATGNVPDEFLMEEIHARALGASNSVQAKWSKGTINGERFVLNSEEKEYPGMGKNGDSIVIPNYGHARGYAKGYAGGDMVGMSLMLGVLAGSQNKDKGPSKQIVQLDSELDRLTKVIKEARSNINDANKQHQSKSKKNLEGIDSAIMGGESAKSQWRSIFQSRLKKELEDIELARQEAVTRHTSQSGAIIKGQKSQMMMDDTRVQIAEKRHGVIMPKLESALLSNQNKIAGVHQKKRGQEFQELKKLEKERDNNLSNIKSSFDQVEALTIAEVEKKREALKVEGSNFDSEIKASKAKIVSLAKAGGKNFVKQTPEIKQQIKDERQRLLSLQTQKQARMQSGQAEISSFSQSSFQTLQGKIFKATQDELAAHQKRVSFLRQKTDQEIKQEEDSLTRKSGIISMRITKEQEALDSAKRKAAFSRQDFQLSVKQHSLNIENVNKDFEAKAQIARASNGGRRQQMDAKIDSGVSRVVSRLSSENNQSFDNLQNQRRESVQKRWDARKEMRTVQKEKNLLQAQEEQKTIQESKNQSMAFKASIGFSALAGSGVITKALGDGQLGESVQGVTENLGVASQVISALPSKVGIMGAALVFAAKSAYDLGVAYDAKTYKKMEVEFDALKNKTSRISGGLTEYSQIMGTLSSSYGDANVSTANLIQMQNKASKIFGELPSDIRGKIIAASSNEERQDVINKAQMGMEKEKETKETSLDIEKRFHESNKSNYTSTLMNPLEWIGGAIGGVKHLLGVEDKSPEMFQKAGVFHTVGAYGIQTEADKMKDEADARSYASGVNKNMSSEDTLKAIAAFNTSKGKTSQERILALGSAGVLDSGEAGKIAQTEGGSSKVVKNLEEMVFASEAGKLAQEALNEKSKEYNKQIFYINKELEIMRQTSQSVYASMNADVTSYVKGLVSASSSLVKLNNAKRTGQIENMQAKEEIYGMKYGANTMNSIKFAGKRAELLTDTGNKESEAKDKAAGDIVGVVMSKILSSSNSVFKNTDGSSNVSPEALYAKGALAQIVKDTLKKNPANTDPNTLFKDIIGSIDKLPENRNLGAELKDKNGNIYKQDQIDKSPELKKQQDDNIKMANNAMKLELKSAFANGAGNTEQKAILDTLVAQLDNDKTNAKIQLDSLNRQEQNQRSLIDIQKNSKMFGQLPTSKKEQRDLERDIRKTSAKAARGDIYSQNKLLKMASETFGDDLKEDSVKGLKDKVKLGESSRIQKMVGLFGKSGLISGLPGQYDDKRIKQISADKVDTLLKTEKGKGFDADALVNGSLDKQLVDSNKSLKNALESLEKTLTSRINSSAGPIPESAVQDAAQKQQALKDKEKSTKEEMKKIKDKREAEIKDMQTAFTQSLKEGLKIGVDGTVGFEVKGADGLSAELVEAVKKGLDGLVKDKMKELMTGARAGDPTKVARVGGG